MNGNSAPRAEELQYNKQVEFKSGFTLYVSPGY